MSVHGKKVMIKDLGSHILVEDSLLDFYIYEKVDEWILRQKKIRGEVEAPEEVYEALWTSGYQVL